MSIRFLGIRFLTATMLLLLAFTSCDFKPQSPEKIKAFAEEVERRKIKQVTNIDMLEASKSISESILSVVNRSNIDSLQQAYLCEIYALSLSDTSFPDSISFQIAEAYKYSVDLKQEIKASCQFSPKEDYLIYTKPRYAQSTDNLVTGFWYIKHDKKDIILKL